MKKLITTIFVFVLLAGCAGQLPKVSTQPQPDLEEILRLAEQAEAVKFRVFYGLTGGGTGALDSFDGASCADGDLAAVINLTTNSVLFYLMNATSAETEDELKIIAPDTNAGDKRWEWTSKFPILYSSDDPDVSVVGQISYDTDRWIRIHDGTYQVGIPLDEPIIKIITEPDNLAEADFLPLWVNETGMTFNITQIKAWSDLDDFDFTLKECSGTDFTSLTTIEAVTVSTNGTGVYYTTVASGSIDHATIEDGHLIGYDNSTDIADFVIIHIKGYFGGNVD